MPDIGSLRLEQRIRNIKKSKITKNQQFGMYTLKLLLLQ